MKIVCNIMLIPSANSAHQVRLVHEIGVNMMLYTSFTMVMDFKKNICWLIVKQRRYEERTLPYQVCFGREGRPSLETM